MPPLLIEQGTNRIIGGLHRWKAYQMVWGEGVMIPCQLVSMPTEEDLFLLAVADNEAHGKRFSPFEETQIIIEAQKKGISLNLLADVMKLPLEKITRRWDGKTGFVRSTSTSTTPASEQVERVPLKHGLRKLKGQELSAPLQELNRRIGGMPLSYYTNIIILMLEADIIELKPELLDQFHRIKNLLDQKLLKDAEVVPKSDGASV